MRKILFRGKRKNNGAWIEGFYYEDIAGNSVILSRPRDFGYADAIDADPATVGQYTGLKDKNGKRIFEGDILRWTGEDGETGKVIVIFAGGSFLLKCVEVLDAPTDPFDEFDRGGQTLEVIGNIHDNPELLEGGEEG